MARGLSRSRRLFGRAQKVLVGGVNSPVRAFKSVGGIPRFIASGRGSRIFDADQNAYIDYCLSWGPLIFGHAHPEIAAAALGALKKGTTFGAPTEGEIRLARLIREAFPSMERVRLTSSGTEAVMSVLRLARAATKRDLIVKFDGGYHGHVDSLLVMAGSGAATLGLPDSPGVPRSWARTTISVPYNDIRSLRKVFQKRGRRIAAAIVEPVAGNMGVVLPEPGFLGELRRLTSARGALLIFDEVITGFRFCLGGAQKIFGIAPDLTCLGKIIGGGFPLAAFGGKKELMRLLAPWGPVYQAGTLSGNPVAVAAAIKALELLKKENPYAGLSGKAEFLTRGLSAEARRQGLNVHVNRFASMFTVFFAEEPVCDYQSAVRSSARLYSRFFHGLLRRGVYFPPSRLESCFVSSAHSERDILRTLGAAREVFKTIS